MVFSNIRKSIWALYLIGLTSELIMKTNLFVPDKMEYARGTKRPNVECILCAIVNGNDEVISLEAYRSEFFVVALNLYPYTPGHLMVFPKRHNIASKSIKRPGRRSKVRFG